LPVSYSATISSALHSKEEPGCRTFQTRAPYLDLKFRSKEGTCLTQQERQGRRAPIHFELAVCRRASDLHSQRPLGDGNAAAAANNIAAHELLFRFGIVLYLLSSALWIFITLAFYRLLKGVDQALAVLMVIFTLVATPLSSSNTVNDVDNATPPTLPDGYGQAAIRRKRKLEEFRRRWVFLVPVERVNVED
jgi:hypothetical protein